MKTNHHYHRKDDNITFKRVLVQIVHRHGDRSPITPLKEEKYWNEQLVLPSSTYDMISKRTVVKGRHMENHPANGRGPFGKLTKRGWDQLVQLGSSIRNELIDNHDAGNNAVVTSDNPNDADNAKDHSHRYFSSSSSRLVRMDDGDDDDNVSSNNKLWLDPHIFSNDEMSKNPSHYIQVYSTDFDRTIQSAQAFLYGFLSSSSSKNKSSFFDDEREDDVDDDVDDDGNITTNNNKNNSIVIETKYMNMMIPDPLPRRTHERIELEHELRSRTYIRLRDDELYPIASRLTQILQPHFAHDANEISFALEKKQKDVEENNVEQQRLQQSHDNTKTNDKNNVKDDNYDDDDDCIEIQPLSWNQLTEITKCLKAHDLMKQYNLSNDDCDAIQRHAAWKWFELYRNPRLIYLSMNPLVQEQINIMKQYTKSYYYHRRRQGLDKEYCEKQDSSPVCTSFSPPPLVTLWSAHDSTLMCLICAYRLRPLLSEWPDYACYLMIELLQKVVPDDNNNSSTSQTAATVETINDEDEEFFYVRFTWNGQILSSQWEQPHGTCHDHDSNAGTGNGYDADPTRTPSLDDNNMLMIIPLSQLEWNVRTMDGLASSTTKTPTTTTSNL